MTPPPPGPTTSPDGNVSYGASAQPPGGAPPQGGPCQAAQITRDPQSGGFTAQCDNGQPQTFQSFPECAAYLASAFGVSQAPPDASAAPGNDVMTESA